MDFKGSRKVSSSRIGFNSLLLGSNSSKEIEVQSRRDVNSFHLVGDVYGLLEMPTMDFGLGISRKLRKSIRA